MDSLRTDPVALGILGALSLGFVAAALFAAIGFAVSSAVSARERLTEFALLRALGLSTRQLSSWLSLENGLLVAFSLASGTALGLVMAYFILPLVSLTQAAAQTIPDITVVIPWRSVLILEGTSLVALVIVVLVLATMLRRIGLGSSLRLGEE
jgi:ABC-type antimicrobial peptide transport system permease subunit